MLRSKESNGCYRLDGISRLNERTNEQTNDVATVRDNRFTRQEVNRFINANNSTSALGGGGRSKNIYATKLIYGVLTTVFRVIHLSRTTLAVPCDLSLPQNIAWNGDYIRIVRFIHTEYYVLHHGKTCGYNHRAPIAKFRSRKCRTTN